MKLRRPAPSSLRETAVAVPMLTVAGLLLFLPGCQPPRPPAPAAPLEARVDVSRYAAFHPAAAQLKALDRELAALERGKGLPAAKAPISVPPAEELPRPALPVPGEPDQTVDLERAEREIREDFRMRREATPRSAPETEAEPPRAAQPAVPPATAEKEVEQQTGLDGQISRLRQQLERLRERPEDRLLYNPAQLRRRRELFELTRAEIARLRQEQVSRLRQALAPRERPAVPRVPRPVPPPVAARDRLSPADERRLRDEEEAALRALREHPELPAPEIGAVGEPPLDIHEEARGRLREKVAGLPAPARQATPARESYLRALRARRDALRAAIQNDVQAAAAVAARERGWVLSTRSSARDVTADLAGPVRQALGQTGLRARH